MCLSAQFISTMNSHPKLWISLVKTLSQACVQGNAPQLVLSVQLLPCRYRRRNALCLLTQQILLTLPKQCQVRMSCLRHPLTTQQSSDLLPSSPLLSLQWAYQSQGKLGQRMKWEHLFHSVWRARMLVAMQSYTNIKRTSFTVTI